MSVNIPIFLLFVHIRCRAAHESHVPLRRGILSPSAHPPRPFLTRGLPIVPGEFMDELTPPARVEGYLAAMVGRIKKVTVHVNVMGLYC
jgi:hypothetical protein